MKNALIPVLAVAVLAGCATTSPIAPAIRTAPPSSPDVAEVRENPGEFDGDAVRWGGTIASVENRRSATMIQVVARPLSNNGRPRSIDRSDGRFLARVDGFLDPVIYAPGRQLTVAGALTEAQTRTIGEYIYKLPVVEVDAYRLWEPLPEPSRVIRQPLYRDPFFDDRLLFRRRALDPLPP